MEGLLILLTEFIIAPCIALVVIAANITLLALDLVFEIVFSISTKRNREQKTVTTKKEKVSTSPNEKLMTSSLLPKLRVILPAMLFTIMAGIFILNSLFFEKTVDWITQGISSKTSMSIAYENVSGSFLSGNIRFHGLKLARNVPEKDQFSIRAQDLAFKLNLPSLLTGKPHFKSVTIANANAHINHIMKEEQYSQHKHHHKRKFVIDNVKLSDIQLLMTSSSKQPIKLVITDATNSQFRSDYAFFDLLFRSNVSATLNGHKIDIHSDVINGGRATTWKMNNIPLNLFSQYMPKPPLSWLSEGTADINVVDSWSLADSPEISMHWQMLIKDAKIVIPGHVGYIKHKMLAPIVKRINNKGTYDAHFKLDLDEREFKFASSADIGKLFKHLFAKQLVHATTWKTTPSQPVQ